MLDIGIPKDKSRYGFKGALYAGFTLDLSGF